MTDKLDRRIKALGRLYRTKAGKQIIRDHGPAILDLMVSDLGPATTTTRKGNR